MRNIIQRYGENPYGANPAWIRRRRLIGKGIPVPGGWEEMSNTEYRIAWASQQPAYDTWLSSISTQITEVSEEGFSDYKQAREHLKGLVAAKGFANCTYLEKVKACEWFVVHPDEMMDFYTNGVGMGMDEALREKIRNGAVFNMKSKESRRARYYNAFHYIRNVLERDELEAIYQDLIANRLIETYIDGGMEGTMKTNYEGVPDPYGIFDYILAGDRITVPRHGIPKQVVIDTIMDILDNGNYYG